MHGGNASGANGPLHPLIDDGLEGPLSNARPFTPDTGSPVPRIGWWPTDVRLPVQHRSADTRGTGGGRFLDARRRRKTPVTAGKGYNCLIFSTTDVRFSGLCVSIRCISRWEQIPGPAPWWGVGLSSLCGCPENLGSGGEPCTDAICRPKEHRGAGGASSNVLCRGGTQVHRRAVCMGQCPPGQRFRSSLRCLTLLERGLLSI